MQHSFLISITVIGYSFTLSSLVRLLIGWGWMEFEQIPWLAVQVLANRLQRGEPDGLCLPSFEDGEVLGRDAYSLGKIIEFHFPPGKHDV